MNASPPTDPTSSNVDKLSAIGARGLVIYDNDKYYYVKEEDWRKLQISKTRDSLLSVLDRIQKQPLQLLLNLDTLDALAGVKRNGKDQVGGGPIAKNSKAIFVLDEAKEFYVPESAWLNNELKSALEYADAQVLITRGVMLAVIPPNSVPVGAYCVLVNFGGVSTT